MTAKSSLRLKQSDSRLRLRTFRVRWLVLLRALAVGILVFPCAMFVVGPLSWGSQTRFEIGMVLVGLGALALVVRHSSSAVCIDVSAGDLDVRDGLFWGDRVRVRTRDVRQVFSVEHSWVDGANKRDPHAGQRITARRLVARLVDGRDVTLAAGLATVDANALEQALEAFLAIRDVPMVGGTR